VVRRGVRPALSVAQVEEHGATARAATSLDVTPAITDHEAGGQVDRVRHRRVK
jgi:hypothetical protein